jgi:hypothetical protein
MEMTNDLNNKEDEARLLRQNLSTALEDMALLKVTIIILLLLIPIALYSLSITLQFTLLLLHITAYTTPSTYTQMCSCSYAECAE